MLKKIGYLIITIIVTLGMSSAFSTPKAFAQGSTTVLLTADKTNYYTGDTIKVTIKAQNVIDLFGIQFTLHYDPGMLSLEGNGFTFSEGYTVFGGSTVDQKNGIMAYPVINKNPSLNEQGSVTVGSVLFRAIKDGPATLSMDNIKTVNRDSTETNYNTQTQTVFNIAKASRQSSSGSDSTGSTGQSTNGESIAGSNINKSSGYAGNNAQGLAAATISNGTPAAYSHTASQEQNGNSTNHNVASSGRANNAQNSQKNSMEKKISGSTSSFNTILTIIVIMLIIGGAILAFLKRKGLKNIFSRMTNREN